MTAEDGRRVSGDGMWVEPGNARNDLVLDLNDELDAARAEIARLRVVVEAARRVKRGIATYETLYAALDALEVEK